MPIRDKETNRVYQREWQRKIKRTESPEEREIRLSKRRMMRRRRIDSGNLKELEYEKSPRSRKRKHDWYMRDRYGEFAEAKELLNQLYELRRTDPKFEVIPEVRAEKFRPRRVYVKK